MKIELVLNTVATTWEISPGETLLEALRRFGCLSVKRGCETGDCGACTVLLDNEPVNACVVAAGRVRGHMVTTLEGLQADPLMNRLQAAFVAGGAIQCGYCTPGMLLSTYALLKEGKEAKDDAVRDALSGNLCRCTGYLKPVQAVLAVWEDMAREGDS